MILDSLNQLATSVDVRTVILPSGRRIAIAHWTIRFRPAIPDHLPVGTLSGTYANKPLVMVDEEPLFGELAIVRWLQKDGWDAVWVDAFHSSQRRRLLWQGLPDRSSPYDLSQVPHAWEMFQRIIHLNGGKIGGFFDVLAWQGGRLLFLEYKGEGDRLKKSERAWMGAALTAGVSEEDLLYIGHPQTP